MSETPSVPDTVLKLIEKYEFNKQAFHLGKYNETQLRVEYINPLFVGLGWDVYNNEGNSEAYKEVLHEEPIKIGATTQFIDYTFRIGGVRKFIIETKKPSVRIKDDSAAALQVRRYAWNAKLPLNILTNFEEWAIYDCTIKPSHNDNASIGRIEYFTYQDLPKKWDWLATIFTQKGILKGSFDKYVGEKKKKGTSSVDETFLAEIEEWRDHLAKNFALRNPSLTVDELNDAVQKTIDRIIFLRICEDRGIEKYGTLQDQLKNEGIYQNLCTLFLDADERYNSGLFHFQEEKDNHETPDRYTLSLHLDDKVLKDLIKRLYYPESPFEFNIIPPAILGHVYEQFLGKVIRLTEGHQARVEYKPEVKKAGGVFYTPEYIVSYIVQHTVGELVKDKTPKDVAKLRILDPACGSGSFLLGAYKFLLEWHRDWYIQNLVPVLKEKGASSSEVKALLPPDARGAENLPIYKAGNGSDSRVRSDWNLTTAERKRILLNNIYGVDIDRQAVEVTKLSLLLKVLEEENEETVSKQLKLFKERALPSLHENIKCGNSLVGWDIVTPDMPSDEIKRINPFDWDAAFSEIIKKGGFDVVIGNPPYVRMESLERSFKDYAESNYSSHSGRADLYVYFIEKSHYLLREKGYLGFICASKFMKTKYGLNIRTFLIQKMKLKEIVDFGELPVFSNASTFPAIYIIQNNSVAEQKFVYALIKHLNFNSLADEVAFIGKQKDNRSLNGVNWTLADDNEIELIAKMNSRGIPLGEIINHQMFMGIKSGLTKAFEIDQELRAHILEKNPEAQEIIKPFVNGKNVRRFYLDFQNIFIIYTYHGIDMKKYPAIINHLNKFKDDLKQRATKQEWYELQQPQYGLKQFLESPKILIPDIAKESRMTFDVENHYVSNTVYFIPTKDLYLFGVLNSKLIFNYYKRISTVIGDADQGGRLRWFRQDVERIPFRTINFSDPADVARHDTMVKLVERMLELNKRLPDAKTPQEQDLIKRQIAATDKEIDNLVYELYGLTDEERKIVERAGE